MVSPLVQEILIPLEERFTKLYVPLSGKTPCGEFIHRTVEFDRIRDLRDSEETHGKPTDWVAVERLSLDLLSQKTKDFQVLGWLCEAWLRQEWLVGLAWGLATYIKVAEDFWDQVHPQIEDGDVQFRLATITWLDHKLVGNLRMFPLFGGAALGGHTYGELVKSRNIPPELANQKDFQVVQAADIKNSFVGFPEPAVQELIHHATNCVKLHGELQSMLEEKLQKTQVLHNLGKSLTNILRFYQGLPQAKIKKAKPARPPASEEKPTTEEKIPSSTEMSGDMNMPTDAPKSREEAYEQLAKIAAFLEYHEPHSPTPYLIRRAIGWGGMTYGQLLADLFQTSGGNINQIMAILGLDQPSQGARAPMRPQQRHEPEQQNPPIHHQEQVDPREGH